MGIPGASLLGTWDTSNPNRPFPTPRRSTALSTNKTNKRATPHGVGGWPRSQEVRSTTKDGCPRCLAFGHLGYLEPQPTIPNPPAFHRALDKQDKQKGHSSWSGWVAQVPGSEINHQRWVPQVPRFWAPGIPRTPTDHSQPSGVPPRSRQTRQTKGATPHGVALLFESMQLSSYAGEGDPSG